MIRIVLFVVVYLISQVAQSQTKFEQGMQEAFELMSENKNSEAVNMFERIASAEPENWLPPYHIALLKTRTSFTMKDKSMQEAQIKSAEDYIASAETLSPDNSEVYVVKAMINVAKIASNPMVNGATLSGPTAALYNKAIALDKTNPRAHSGLVEFEMGSARFFKQDLTPYCKRLQESITLYDAFKPADSFSPNWGKGWTLQVIKSCGGSASSEPKIEEVKEVSDELFSLEATVPNISGNEGEVLFALYDSNESLMQLQPLISKKGTIANGKSSVIFSGIKPGVYAIICLHDKNTNGKMDFNPSGMPLEDYGSSNNVMRMGPPNFMDAKFTVENKSLDLTIRF